MKGEGGVKKVPKSVYVVCGSPLIISDVVHSGLEYKKSECGGSWTNGLAIKARYGDCDR